MITDDMEEVKRKRQLEDIKHRYGDAEFRDVLKTYSGRAVLNSVLKECSLYAPIPSDPLNTFRQLGKRDIGIWLRSKLLTIDYNSVILMESESRKREQDLKL